MKAFAIRNQLLTLEVRHKPVPNNPEVLIKIHAVGINRADNLQRLGKYPPPDGVTDIPGLECAGVVERAGSTGSLGHGLPMALGMALAARIQQRPSRCYALLSDGECNEGSIWEAALLAASQKVHTLTAMIDFNKWQATGRSQEVMALDPLAAKWEAFGWESYEVDGHDFAEIRTALACGELPDRTKPLAIVAHTIKGRGVSFMEDDNNWHYRIPNAEELAAARKELGLV
jgi:transketolase